MLHWEIGTVVDIAADHDELMEVHVELDNGAREMAIVYVSFIGKVSIGERVLMNTTSVRMQLGSGGVHFVAARLDKSLRSAAHMDGPTSGAGHIMKLRYTPLQHAVLSVEEQRSPHHEMMKVETQLHRMPVLIGELHSMLPIAVAWSRAVLRNRHNASPPKIVYIMSDGGALPLVFSKHVRQLLKQRWLESTITYGHAFGGNLEAVNKFTALLAAKHIYHADLAIITMGPGIVGTGTPLGHSAMEIGEIVNAVNQLGGVPIIMPRISFLDERARHFGLSHHVISALQYAAATSAHLPLPQLTQSPFLAQRLLTQAEQIPERHQFIWQAPPTKSDIHAAIEHYDLPIKTMGRSLHDDPIYFQTICTAMSYGLDLHDGNGGG